MAFLGTLSAAALASLSSILGNLTLFGVILLFVVIGALLSGVLVWFAAHRVSGEPRQDMAAV